MSNYRDISTMRDCIWTKRDWPPAASSARARRAISLIQPLTVRSFYVYCYGANSFPSAVMVMHGDGLKVERGILGWQS
jgi:hypothetical protein